MVILSPKTDVSSTVLSRSIQGPRNSFDRGGETIGDILYIKKLEKLAFRKKLTLPIPPPALSQSLDVGKECADITRVIWSRISHL